MDNAKKAPVAAETDVNQIGYVVSDKREKTITVEVSRLVKHPRYGKFQYRSTRFHAHDEKNEAKLGDKVEIESTRPLSKQKRYRLVKIIERGADLAGVVLKDTEVPGAKKKEAAPVAVEAK